MQFDLLFPCSCPQIETVELCGFSLYLGTTLGKIMRFRLAQDGDEHGRMSSAAKVAEKSMGPVRMLDDV